MGNKISTFAHRRTVRRQHTTPHRQAEAHNHKAQEKIPPPTIAENTPTVVDTPDPQPRDVPDTKVSNNGADYALIKLLDELSGDFPFLKSMIGLTDEIQKSITEPKLDDAVPRDEAMLRLQSFLFQADVKRSSKLEDYHALAKELFPTLFETQKTSAADARPKDLGDVEPATVEADPVCMICCEPTKKAEAAYGCWRCENPICGSCIKYRFQQAINNPTEMPARCCTILPLHVALTQLTDEEANEYRTKFDEWLTADRTYCPVPTCSAFIPERLFPKGSRERRKKANAEKRADTPIEQPDAPVPCPKCEVKVCCGCRKFAHDGPCSEEVSDGLDEVLAQFGYKRCPKCGHGVRRMFGCNHMQCLCGASWCWRCRAPYLDCYGDCDSDSTYDDPVTNSWEIDYNLRYEREDRRAARLREFEAALEGSDLMRTPEIDLEVHDQRQEERRTREDIADTLEFTDLLRRPEVDLIVHSQRQYLRENPPSNLDDVLMLTRAARDPEQRDHVFYVAPDWEQFLEDTVAYGFFDEPENPSPVILDGPSDPASPEILDRASVSTPPSPLLNSSEPASPAADIELPSVCLPPPPPPPTTGPPPVTPSPQPAPPSVAIEEPAPTVEETGIPAVEGTAPAVEEPTPAVEEPTPAVGEPTPAAEDPTPAPEQPTPTPEQPNPPTADIPPPPPPAAPTPRLPRQLNLDAGNHWYNEALDFGAEPQEENQDRSWFCDHGRARRAAPVEAGKCGAGREECNGCWGELFGGAYVRVMLGRVGGRAAEGEKGDGEEGKEGEDGEGEKEESEEAKAAREEKEREERRKEESETPMACEGCGMVYCGPCWVERAVKA